MRKIFNFLVIMVLGAIVPLSAEIRYDLPPIGFEDGAIPAGWTQEHVSGNVLWTVEGGTGVTLSSPSGAHQGSYRLSARRASGDTEHFVTRLISPTFDVTQSYQPELCFSHAQVEFFDHFDTLRVYYRATSSDTWKLLQAYTSSISVWTSERIVLPEALRGVSYQIAFEVSDNAGCGVVLDDIYVMQPSTCEVPSLGIFDITATTAYVELVVGGSGTGSMEDLFDVVVSPIELPDPSSVSAGEVAFYATSIGSNHVNLQDLAPDTKYYIYVRTNCVDNATGYTDWVSDSFTTPVGVDVPYTETFNSVSGNTYGTPYGWTLQTDIDGVSVPYVYTGSSISYKQQYSVDSTAYMAFVGSASTYSSSAIPVGKYAYAATPEINATLSDCEVSFWGTCYESVFDGVTDYAAEITVGVMTDPTDKNTFTAIESVHIESAHLFKKFTISLANYTGSGKYVAFMSNNAQKQNVFYIDNVSIYIPSVPTPTFSVRNVQPSGFEVVPTLPSGAASWNIKVSTDYVRDGGTLTDAQCLVNQSGLTSATYTISVADELLSGKTVLIYVQAAGNGAVSDWSFPTTLRVPTRGAIPQEYTFDTGTYSTIALRSLNNETHYLSTTEAWGDVFFPLVSYSNMYPAVSTGDPTYDGGHLNLNGIDNYFVLPYVDDLDSLELTFYLSVGASYATYTGQSRVAVGVMTDPYDLSTFVQIGTYDGASGGEYVKCTGDLLSYDGSGHYVAIRAIAPATNSPYGSCNAIDDIRLRKVSSCRSAVNVKAEVSAASAVVRWDAVGMKKWLVRVYGDAGLTDMLYEEIVETDSIRLGGLSAETTYYCTVQTICGNDTVEADETCAFTTIRGIPYFESFDSMSSLSSSGWEQATGLASDVFNGQSLAVASYGSWSISSTTGKDKGYVSYVGNILRINNYGSSVKSWVFSPELYLETDDEVAVRLTFDMALTPYNDNSHSGGTDDQFMVVISTDGGATWKAEDATIWNNKNDATTDYVYDDIPMRSFQQYSIDLSSYIGQRIRIAFYAESTVANADNYILIDNLQVRAFDINCQGISRLSSEALSSSEAQVFWTVGGTQSVHIDVFEENSTTALSSLDVTDNPYTLRNLRANTSYVVKAYQSCDSQGDTLQTSFRTFCGAQTPLELGTFTFSDAAVDLLCWRVGVGDTVGVGSTNLVPPAIKSIGGFGNVLYLAKPMRTSSNYYGNNYYAITPELDVESITDYQVTFSAGSNTSASDTANVRCLYVGVVSDPRQPSSFVAVDTLVLPYASDSLGMRTYTVAFDTYDGDYLGEYGKYIMFQVSAPANYSDIVLIDNVLVEPVLSCHQVNDMEVREVSDRTVTLAWGGDAYEYDIKVSEVLSAEGTISDPVFSVRGITDHEITVSGLQPQTMYYAYVRGICGAGDTAQWSGQTAFKTLYAVPYLETFVQPSSLPEDWAAYSCTFPTASDTLTSANMSVQTYYGWIVRTAYPGVTGLGGNVAAVQLSGSGEYDAMLVSPSIILPSSEDALPVRLSFKAAKSAFDYSYPAAPADVSYDKKFIVFISLDDGRTWTRSNSTVWSGDDNGDYDYNDIGLDARRYNIDVTSYAGTSIRVGFYAESKLNEAEAYLYVDSVAVETYTPSCDGVIRVFVSDVGTDNMHLRCKATNQTDTIEYVYGKDDVDWTTAVPLRTDANGEADLSGLQHSSTYAIYVRTLCEMGDTSSWYGPVYANTECIITAPTAYDFDDTSNRYAFYRTSYEDYYIENCWKATNSSSNGLPMIADNTSTRSYAHSGSSALEMVMRTTNTSDYSVCVMPEVSGNLETMQLTFWARAGYEENGNMVSYSSQNYLHSVQVGTMTDPSDISTFQLLKEVMLDGVSGSPETDAMAFWRQQIVSLEKATGKYIAFMQRGSTGFNYLYIDDVEISEMTCPPVNTIWVDSIGASSVKVHWESSAEDYVVTVINSTKSTQYSSSDSVMWISNLLPGTPYSVSVASVCEADTSVASMCTFLTNYGMPFEEEFNSISTTFPANWSRYSGISLEDILSGEASFATSATTASGWGYSSSYNANALEDAKHVAVELYYGYKNYWMLTPVINLTDVSDTIPLEFSFDAALTHWSSKASPYATDGQRFYIVVSEDGGATWDESNTIMWSDDASENAQYTLGSIPTGDGVTYTLDFSKYAGKCIQIAFGVDATKNDNRLHIDNIRLQELLPCSGIIGLVEKTATTTTDTLLLLPAADGGASQWQYAYGEQGSALQEMPVHMTGDTLLVLDALSPGTAYDIYVRSVCGAGDSSRWTGPYTIRTLLTVPYHEEFLSNTFSEGWSRYWALFPAGSDTLPASSLKTTGEGGWNIESVPEGVTGMEGNVARVQVYGTGSYNALLASPLLVLPDTLSLPLNLSFKVARTNFSSTTSLLATSEDDKFSVLISTDNGATWTRQPSTIWASDGTGDYDYNMLAHDARRVYIDMEAYAGQQVRIGFYTESSVSSPNSFIYVDSVALEAGIPSCEGVWSIHVKETKAESVSVYIYPASKSDTIEYVYGKDEVDWATAIPQRADADGNAVLSSLEHSSIYAIYARTLCAYGDTSAWYGPVYANTECLASVPVVYDFDDKANRYVINGTSYSMENCWKALYGTTSALPMIKDNTLTEVYARSDSSALYMSCNTSSSSYSIAVMPELTGDMDTMFLVFWARAGYERNGSMYCSTTSYNHSVQVGTMTDFSDPSTFQLLKEVVLDGVSGNPDADATRFWRQQVVSLSDAQGKYIAFKQAGGSSNYICIDDVSVLPLTCPLVTNVLVDSITSSTARVRWESDADEYMLTLTNGEQEVQYHSFDTVVYLADLQPGTLYNVSVVSVCGADSSIAATGAFTTSYAFPLVEDFSTISTAFPANWSRYYNVNADDLFNGKTFADYAATTTGWRYSVYGANALSDGDHAYVDIEGAYYMERYYWMVSPCIDLGAVSDTLGVRLSFDVALTTPSSADPPSSTSGQRLYVLVSSDGGATWLRDNAVIWSDNAADGAKYAMSDLPNGMGRHYSFNCSKYIGKVVQVAFGASASDGYSGVHIDNIRLDSADIICEDIERVSVGNIYARAAQIIFTPSGINDTVEYVCVLPGILPEEAAMLYRADSTNNVLIGDLAPSTAYDVYARALCTIGDTSAWYGPVGFTTSCLAETPVTYDFNDAGNRYTYAQNCYMENCWTTVYSQTSSVASVKDNTSTSTYGYNGSSGLNFATSAGNPAYAVMPEVNADLDTLQVSFLGRPGYKYTSAGSAYIDKANEAYARSVKVGVMSDPYDASTFELLATITADAVPTTADPANDLQGTEYYRKYTVPLYGVSGKYVAFVSDFDMANNFTIDDVTIERAASCVVPTKLEAAALSSTSAVIRWRSDADSVRVRLVAKDGIDLLYTSSSDSIVITGLSAATQYVVYAQNCCGESETSEWSNAVSLVTLCAVPYVQEFETALDNWMYARGELSDVLSGGSLTLGTSNWEIGNRATAAESNIFSGSAYINLETSYAASSSRSKKDWLISPVIDLTDADTERGLYLSMVLALSSSYSHAAVDPAQQEQYRFAVVISTDGGETWTEENTTLWNNEGKGQYVLNEIPVAGDWYYVDLSRYMGKSIRIALYAESLSGRGDVYLYVDNFTIDYVDVSCVGIADLKVLAVTSDSVNAQWRTLGNDSVNVLLTDMNGVEIFSAVTTDNTLQYAGLSGNMTYVLRVAQRCGSSPKEIVFTTPYAVPYYEPFATESDEWTKAEGILSHIVTGGAFSTSATGNWHWNQTPSATEENIHGGHFYINISGHSVWDWLISPVIYIPALDSTRSLELSLTLALNSTNGHAAVDPDQQMEHRFAVVISEDGGATWKQENVFLWDNKGEGNFAYNAIPVKGETYKINMEQYAGKTVKVALYAEALESGGDNNLYVDDLSLKFIEKVTYFAEACNSSDYQDTYFTIPRAELQEGTMKSYQTQLAGVNNASDTVVTMWLTVYPAERVTLHDTVCQGTMYTGYGFERVINESMTLSARFTSSNGCDSLVEVHVEVIPTVYADTTIYACSEYVLNGQTYYSSQVVMDTLVSALGCDSISRIFLQISPESRYESEWRTAICAGSTYSDDVFADVSEPGTYVETVATQYGCDSVLTLHLLVADANMCAYDSIELEELPYIYEGDVILNGVLEKGKVYEHDVKADCGTITLYIYINGEMGIDGAVVGNFTLLPNPSRVGEDIRIHYPLQPADDYMLTVHDALGQAVYTTRKAQSVIPGLHVSGCYVVRIVNEGKVFQAKLIVQ